MGFLASASMILMSFITSLTVIYYVVASFPPLPANLAKAIAPDRSLISLLTKPTQKDLRLMGSVVQFYMRDFYWSVVILLCSVYIFLQAFAIPGPAIIAVLMAGLFGGWVGGSMSMACALIGSSMCYFIFRLVGRPVLRRYFAQGLASMSAKVTENEGNIFYYFLFLRVTPILPNWFINISSGNVGISYPVFFFGSLLGLIPNAIILTRAGIELAAFGESGNFGGFDIQRVLGLLGVGLLALLPVIIKKILT